MDHSKKHTYVFSIDALRVIAILAVLLIHSTTTTLQVLNHNVQVAPFSLFLNQFARFAVPLFFLISGFVLELNYQKGYSYGSFFKKRASRVIVPFVFWSIFYVLIGNKFRIESLLTPNFLKTLFDGTASYHLYFIPSLIIFYIAFPILHSAMTYLKRPTVLIILVSIQLLLLYQDYYINKFQLGNWRIILLSFSLFIIGMVASHVKEDVLTFIKKYIAPISAITIACIFLIYFHVYDLTLSKKTTSFIYNQNSPLNYIFTLLFTAVGYYVFEKTQFARKLLISLSKLSFFVFFIHVYIQSLVWNVAISFVATSFGKNILTFVLFDPIVFIVISTLSFGIAFLIHKIPFVPKITG